MPTTEESAAMTTPSNTLVKKLFIGGNVMSGKIVVRQLLDGHPNVLCNHLHDLLGQFLFSNTVKQIFQKNHLESYLSVQKYLPCITIRYNDGSTALVDVGDFFSAMYRFSNYKILHKYAAGQFMYNVSKEGPMERHPFSFDFPGFERDLKDRLFSGERTFSAEEVVDVIYSSYEMNWKNKHHHLEDYWFVNSLHNGIGPILDVTNNLPDAKIIVMDRDPISLLFCNAIRMRSYFQMGDTFDNKFRKTLFNQDSFIKKIKKFRTSLAELEQSNNNVLVVDFNQITLDTVRIMKEISRFLGIDYTKNLSMPSLCGEEISNSKYPIIGKVNDDPYQLLCRKDVDLLRYLYHGFNKDNGISQRCSLIAHDLRWRKAGIGQLKRR